MNKELLSRIGKPVLGLGLLLLLVSQLDMERLRSIASQISVPWFLAALILAVLANALCALRWRKIVGIFGHAISPNEAIRLYFQGVTANTVLPGGIVGGDIWRTIGLARKGVSKMGAARTVLLDRVAGFWGLSLLSLAALGIAWSTNQIPAGIASEFAVIYGFLLAGAAIAPMAGFVVKLSRESGAIFQTTAFSITVQLMTMMAFWCCLMAVGSDIRIALLASVCAGIFLGAVVPASIGGFGSREVAAVFFLSAVGISPEPGFVASFLFGLTATIQGLAFFLLVLKGHRPKA